MSFVEIVLLVAITKLSAVKVAKASSRGPFENFDKNSWATSVSAVSRIARSQKFIETDVNIVDCKNVWPRAWVIDV